MGRQFLAATSDMAYRDPHDLSSIGGPIISLWLWRIDNTQNCPLWEYAQNNGWDYVANAFLPGELIRSYHGGVQWSDKYLTPPATGAWHHYFMIVPGSGEGIPPPNPLGNNRLWIDGTEVVLTVNTHSSAGVPDANQPFTVMGRRVAGVNSKFLSGRIAEFAMWSSHDMIVNPAPFVKQLAAGCNPMRVRHTEMIMYVPYFGQDNPEPDYHGAMRSFTLNGSPTRVTHPPTVRSFVNFQD